MRSRRTALQSERCEALVEDGCTRSSSKSWIASSRRGGGVVEQPVRGPPALQRRLGGLRGREALVEPFAHAADALGVGGGVEPESAGRADGLQQPVAALPGAQKVGAHADATRELSDA